MKLEEFHDRQIPPYAILSHTWGEREATYQDFCSWISDSAADGLYPEPTHPGLEKIKSFAVWAHNSGHEHIWVDTCCIDKSSSAELSEAINSMYKWYRNSQICCVYLVDVPPYGTNHDLELLVGWERKFRESRWLTRGWTLQEILAPKAVKFVANDWETTLDEEYIYGLITEQTAIPRRALEEFKPARWSIAQRMSWAASRETTREEDRAYCLLGLFGVHMPLLYGEGSRAFLRLQEEILKTATDQSIFCW
ncbi:HET-domain-containing protein, partial [Microthyrium microscopicum]